MSEKVERELWTGMDYVTNGFIAALVGAALFGLGFVLEFVPLLIAGGMIAVIGALCIQIGIIARGVEIGIRGGFVVE